MRRTDADSGYLCRNSQPSAGSASSRPRGLSEAALAATDGRGQRYPHPRPGCDSGHAKPAARHTASDRGAADGGREPDGTPAEGGRGYPPRAGAGGQSGRGRTQAEARVQVLEVEVGAKLQAAQERADAPRVSAMLRWRPRTEPTPAPRLRRKGWRRASRPRRRGRRGGLRRGYERLGEASDGSVRVLLALIGLTIFVL